MGAASSNACGIVAQVTYPAGYVSDALLTSHYSYDLKHCTRVSALTRAPTLLLIIDHLLYQRGTLRVPLPIRLRASWGSAPSPGSQPGSVLQGR